MEADDFLLSFPDFLRFLFMVLYLSTFALFLAVDVVKAFKKRKHWVPGKSLVLSALTISVITFVDLNILNNSEVTEKGKLKVFVDLNILNNSEVTEKGKLKVLLHYQLLIDGGRLGVCVFMGYVLPGMVGTSSGKDLKLIAAFLINFVPQILAELSFVYGEKKDLPDYIRKGNHKAYSIWFIVSNSVFLVSIIFLICASFSTVLAGYTIRNILRKRISVILAGDEMVISRSGDPEVQSTKDLKKCCWNDFEEEIFKLWIVARASQPDYVIARSVLNSAAATVVSLCIILSILKARPMHSNYYDILHFFSNSSLWLLFEVCAICCFLLVGWAVILCRWITALIFFPKFAKGTFSLRRYFCVEEFWTSSILEVIHIYDMKASPLYQRPDDINSLLTVVVARMRLHKLLYLLCTLQICVVLLTKSCLFLFELVFSKVIVIWLHNNKEGDRSLVSGRRYEDYADILERVCMPGEDPASLWNASRSSITQLHLLMKDGHDKGKECDILISISHQFSAQFIEEGHQLMDRLRREALPQVTKYFPNLDETCWKMTAVSLLHLLIQLDGQKSDRLSSAVKACRQAWDLMNLVDYTHIEADKLVGFSLLESLSTESHQLSMAADKEFCRLQALHEDLPISTQIKTSTECVSKLSNDAVAILKDHMLLEHEGVNYVLAQRKAAESFDLHDSIKWMEIAPKYSLYKLCRLVEVEANGVNDLAAWTDRKLKNVIAGCLSKLPHVLIKYSRRLAQEFDEDNLWNVIFLAGKVRGFMEGGLQLILELKKIEQEIEWTVETTQLESISDQAHT